MKKNSTRLPYSLKNLLAIWQQVEYDSTFFQKWLQEEPRSPELTHHIQGIQPETWTKKIQLIYRLSQALRVLRVPAPQAIRLSTQFFAPLEKINKWWIIWRAKGVLRRAQQKGLKVIAVAGSYGKTSVKQSVHHMMSHSLFCLKTPASYNTPLGIAKTVLSSLRPDHQCFIVELGEYQQGDIAELLELTRPDFGILTPIGFAHMERFQTMAAVTATFAEMLTSKHAAKQVIVAAQNRTLLAQAVENRATRFLESATAWYGPKTEYAVESFTPQLTGSSFTLRVQDKQHAGETPLLGAQQLENTLPAFWLLSELKQPLLPGLKSVEYHPPIERRLEVHRNPNRTWVVDNGYNTNPGSWAKNTKLLQRMGELKVFIITGGFVELDDETAKKSHATFAKALAEHAVGVGILPTRYNEQLRKDLQKYPELTVIEGLTREEILQKLPQSKLRPDVIWFEGGLREMYQ